MWSFQSPLMCLRYLKNHLCRSGKHKLSDEAAQRIIEEHYAQSEIVWGNYLDTYADRQLYRDSLQAANTAKDDDAAKNVVHMKPIAPVKRKAPDDGPKPIQLKGRKTRDDGAAPIGSAAHAQGGGSSSASGSANPMIPMNDLQSMVNVALKNAMSEIQMGVMDTDSAELNIQMIAKSNQLSKQMVNIDRSTLRAAVQTLTTAEGQMHASIVQLAKTAKEMSIQKDILSTVRKQIMSVMTDSE